MKTLLLDRTAWDLVLDGNGNIALGGEPYSIAQDVASAIRTFQGECRYAVNRGIPYWQRILGMYPPLQFVKAQIVSEALMVPDTVEVQVISCAFTNRGLTAQIQIVDTEGQTSGVSI